jgi:hypothetical protein
MPRSILLRCALFVASVGAVAACANTGTSPATSAPPPGSESSMATTTTNTTPPSITAPSVGPSSPSSVKPRFLEEAPDGCTYTREYWPPVPGYVSARVAMPERPGQADDEQPARDHLEANERFTAYADIDCSGVTYVVIVPYKYARGDIGLVRKTDAVKVAQAPPTSV